MVDKRLLIYLGVVLCSSGKVKAREEGRNELRAVSVGDAELLTDNWMWVWRDVPLM